MSEANGPDDVLLASLQAVIKEVKDPELGVSLVGLGLIRGVAVKRGHVRVRLTFTSMGCPWTEFIQVNLRERLLAVPGVQSVEIEEVWYRPWTRRDLDRVARRRLREMGIVA